MSVVIVGTLALDTIETPFERKENILGGSCTFASVAASYYAKTGIIGVVGDDFPQAHITLLQKRGIDTSGLIKEKGKTFHWEGKYHFDMNSRETLATDLNVLAKFKPRVPDAYKAMPYLFLANIDPDLQLEVLDNMPKVKFSLCDTMNYWIETKKDKLTEVFKRVDAVVLNDSEIREFTGKTNLILAAKEIKLLGPKYVIIKRGEHGASVLGPDMYFILGAYPVETVIDPTGAGDSFAGAFIGYIAQAGNTKKDTIKKAVVHANAVASYSLEDFSINRLLTLSNKKIAARVKEVKKVTNF